jgi:hypothetical protein
MKSHECVKVVTGKVTSGANRIGRGISIHNSDASEVFRDQSSHDVIESNFDSSPTVFQMLCQ